VKNRELSPPGLLLDVGCGTGENAIFLAQNGFTTYAVDIAQPAIERAIVEAKQRQTKVDFRMSDALNLEFDDEMFDYVTDCGLFHTFDDTRRRRFVEEIARVTKPGGTYFILCFSDKEPTNWGGPRRVSRKELLTFLSPSFTVNYVRDELFATRIHNEGGKAYLASATRKSN
jgi:ubiquinone/menaquinone biosynthesis C-methylase UbiE